MQQAAQPEQTQQHQLGEEEVGYHRVAPFHGGETGALYPFCRLLNYPHDRGTRPVGDPEPGRPAHPAMSGGLAAVADAADAVAAPRRRASGGRPTSAVSPTPHALAPRAVRARRGAALAGSEPTRLL